AAVEASRRGFGGVDPAAALDVCGHLSRRRAYRPRCMGWRPAPRVVGLHRAATRTCRGGCGRWGAQVQPLRDPAQGHAGMTAPIDLESLRGFTPGPWRAGDEHGAEQLRPSIRILRDVTYVEGA